jgi:pimeloyl-ACP methyl ester carboxylesterase
LPAQARPGLLPTTRGPLAVIDVVPEVTAVTGVTGSAGFAPVVMVPGFTGSKEDFGPLLGPVTQAGHRVVAIDQRGQFESPPATHELAYDVHELGADVLAVVDALDAGPVHLLGHSFGGLVARAAVLIDAGCFASLTLMSSGPAAVPAESAIDAHWLLDALATMKLDQLWATMRQLDTERGVPALPPNIADFLQRRFLANDPAGLRRLAEQLLEEPDRVDALTGVLLATHTPALVVTGERDDRWSPASQAEMARRLGVPHVLIPAAAHSPNVENPAATAAALLEFWDTCP